MLSILNFLQVSNFSALRKTNTDKIDEKSIPCIVNLVFLHFICRPPRNHPAHKVQSWGCSGDLCCLYRQLVLRCFPSKCHQFYWRRAEPNSYFLRCISVSTFSSFHFGYILGNLSINGHKFKEPF